MHNLRAEITFIDNLIVSYNLV